MAGSASPLDVPLHTNLGILVERRRGLLRQAHEATAKARRVPLLVSLQSAIKRYLAEANTKPKPFRWTKDPDEIIAAVRRGYQALDSNH